jgi:hypothetical protein
LGVVGYFVIAFALPSSVKASGGSQPFINRPAAATGKNSHAEF